MTYYEFILSLRNSPQWAWTWRWLEIPPDQLLIRKFEKPDTDKQISNYGGDEMPEDVSRIGARGINNGNLLFLSWDIDCGHGHNAYPTSAEAVAAGCRLRQYLGHGEVRRSTNGEGVHVRADMKGYELLAPDAGKLARGIAKGSGVAVCSAGQALWLWTRHPNEDGKSFELVEEHGKMPLDMPDAVMEALADRHPTALIVAETHAGLSNRLATAQDYVNGLEDLQGRTANGKRNYRDVIALAHGFDIPLDKALEMLSQKGIEAPSLANATRMLAYAKGSPGWKLRARTTAKDLYRYRLCRADIAQGMDMDEAIGMHSEAFQDAEKGEWIAKVNRWLIRYYGDRHHPTSWILHPNFGLWNYKSIGRSALKCYETLLASLPSLPKPGEWSEPKATLIHRNKYTVGDTGYSVATTVAKMKLIIATGLVRLDAKNTSRGSRYSVYLPRYDEHKSLIQKGLSVADATRETRKDKQTALVL